MSDDRDIVQILRENADGHLPLNEAADEIERLRAEVGGLKSDLRKRIMFANEDGTFSLVRCERCDPITPRGPS